MQKRINYYKVDLYLNSIEQPYTDIKKHIKNIINNNAYEINDMYILELNNSEGLHVFADIFEYDKKQLFLRLSGQHPTGSYIQRDYDNNIPKAVFNGKSEEERGIEAYTYLFYRYDTGILQIVNQNGAPSYKKLNDFFTKYSEGYLLKFNPIPNPNGIDLFYGKPGTSISKVEIEVPVPNADALERIFKWDAKDILNFQQSSFKAVLELSCFDRKKITTNSEQTDKFIDVLKNSITSDIRKLKLRGKLNDKKTQEYNFFDENFSYFVDVPTYKVVAQKKIHYSAAELIPMYKEHLEMAYSENVDLLLMLTNRTEINLNE